MRYLAEIEEAKILAVVRERCAGRESEFRMALHSGMRRSEKSRIAQFPDGGLRWVRRLPGWCHSPAAQQIGEIPRDSNELHIEVSPALDPTNYDRSIVFEGTVLRRSLTTP